MPHQACSSTSVRTGPTAAQRRATLRAWSAMLLCLSAWYTSLSSVFTATVSGLRPEVPRHAPGRPKRCSGGSVPSSSPLTSPFLPLSTGSHIFSNRCERTSLMTQMENHHRHYRHRCHHPFLWQLFVSSPLMLVSVLLVIVTLGHVTGQESNTETSVAVMDYQNPPTIKEHVCGSIDVRNEVKELNSLTNCTVIEGHLQIVLIDKGDPRMFENLTFPHLREITDYFLVFRLSGIYTLGKLFPNLAVIRGRELVHNYAFVVYEMVHLQEIGLHNLVHIMRGDVRIEKNSNLCFVDTIDWSRIARNFLISGNRDQTSCPNCNESCPMISARRDDGTSIGDVYNRVCWNQSSCQIHSCPSSCDRNLTCSESGQCCPEQCIGGCIASPDNPANLSCIACRNFVYRGRCYDKCPEGTFEFYNRRCLSESKCISIKLSDHNNKDRGINVHQESYMKPFNGKCEPYCPVGYSEDPNNRHTCYACGADCPKYCSSGQISNIATAQNMKGCTHINGSLEIHISSGGAQIVKELEESLKHLVEITGFLKISRSFPLISLNFLRSLKVIRGETLEHQAYSLLILDNPNLQDLWVFSNDTSLDGEKRIELQRGRIFIHINPKLCYNKLKKLTSYMEMKDMPPMPWDERDVSRLSNGDRVPCDVAKINVSLWGVASEVVGISWTDFKPQMKDIRSLLGYLIYFREAPHRNVTIFDGRDACSNNDWTVIEFDAMEGELPVSLVNSSASSITESNVTKVDATRSNSTVNDLESFNEQRLQTRPPLMHILPNLKPYTQYALYIKTYTISTETKGGISDIFYFTTAPDTPSQPRNMLAKATTHSDLVVTWEPPSRPNGEVTHYVVRATKEQLPITHRDYCREITIIKETPSQVKPTLVMPKEPVVNHWLGLNSTDASGGNMSFPNDTDLSTSSNKKCCACTDKQISNDPNEVEQKITFQDYLMNRVYIKRINNTEEATSSQEDTSSGSGETKNPKKREVVELYHDLNATDSNATMLFKEQDGLIYPDDEAMNSTMTANEEATTMLPELDQWIYHQSVNTQFVEIGGLEHFTEYTIEVMACHDPIDNKSLCSVTAITSVRTLPLGGADDIEKSSISYDLKVENSTQMLYIHWDEPLNPNGIIFSYEIEHTRITSSNDKQRALPFCVPLNDYLKHRGARMTSLLPGNYSIRLRARSLANYGNWTDPFFVYIEDSDSNNWLLISGLLIGFLVVILFLGGTSYYRFVKNYDYISVNPEYISSGLVYNADPAWEVPRDNIRLIRELGEGTFGKVFEGEFTKDNTPLLRCAIKTVNQNAHVRERISFLKEADTMKSFTDCHHVVKLLGICSKGQPPYVLMEIMPRGDLRNYLRANRPDNEENPMPEPPSLFQIYKMAIEIADGMAYLASKKYVHRDLAARNCMLANDLTVKIGDFGMARDIYESDYYRKGDKGFLPVRWMSPEALQDGIFTTYSDAWAYGIVLWEMVTLASQPYQGLSNEEVLKFVMDGKHMLMPDDCPEILWRLMTMCWNRKPKSRPAFRKIIEMLLDFVVEEDFLDVSFYGKKKREMEGERSSSENLHDESMEPLTNRESDGSDVEDQFLDDDMDVQFFPISRIPINFATDGGCSTSNMADGANNGETVTTTDTCHDVRLDSPLLRIGNNNNNSQSTSNLDSVHITFPRSKASISSTNSSVHDKASDRSKSNEMLPFAGFDAITPIKDTPRGKNNNNNNNAAALNVASNNHNMVNGHLMNTSMV